MTINKLLLFAFTIFSVALAPTSTFAADSKASVKPPHWMVLIQSRSYPGWKKALLEKDGTPEACLTRNCAKDIRWDTFFSDDKSQAKLTGLYVANGHIFDVRRVKETRTKINKHGYKIVSTVVGLIALQLGTPEAPRWLGQQNWKDSNSYILEQNENEPTADSNKPKDKVIFTYDGDNSVIAVFGPWLSVIESASTYAFGTPHPYGNSHWQIYKLAPDTLKKEKMAFPNSVTAQIRAGYKKLFYDLPAEMNEDSGQALCPAGGTAMVETFYAPERTSQGVVLVKLPQAVPPSYESTKNEFIAKNKNLIDWNKAKVFTVAPDQSAVVYVLDNDLYWRSVSTAKPRLIGKVVDVRGWQWIDMNSLTDAERQKLSLSPSSAVPTGH